MREGRQLVTESTANSRRGTKCSPQRPTWRRIVEREPGGRVEPVAVRTVAVVARDTLAVGVPKRRAAGGSQGVAPTAHPISPQVGSPGNVVGKCTTTPRPRR